MDKKKVKKGYNKVARKYSATRTLFKNREYLLKFNSLLKPHSTILDIGSGSGKPVDEFFISKGHNIIGIDISEKQIHLAKKNFPNHTFEVKDMDKLVDGEYKVDAIVSFYAIFHIPRGRHQILFQKLSSFLPKGGFLLTTMGSSEWEGKEDFHGVEMHWSHFGRKKNRRIIEKSGFQVILDEIDTAGNERHQVIIAKKL